MKKAFNPLLLSGTYHPVVYCVMFSDVLCSLLAFCFCTHMKLDWHFSPRGFSLFLIKVSSCDVQ